MTSYASFNELVEEAVDYARTGDKGKCVELLIQACFAVHHPTRVPPEVLGFIEQAVANSAQVYIKKAP